MNRKKFYTRKDDSPNKTIKKIKEILKKNKIKTRITDKARLGNNIFSIRIELTNLSGIGANGKGASKMYALASAYAELMERLQTGFLLKSTYMNKDEIPLYNISPQILSINKFMGEFSELFSKIFTNDSWEKETMFFEFIKKHDEFRGVSNYYNLFNHQEKELPERIINIMTQSNGLCAGNSFEEAITQGISEVMERYCYRTILYCKQTLPRVIVNDKEYLDIIEPLKKSGFICEIVDCSLNGRFPVIGLLVYTTDRKYYRFSMGADPEFYIALQRCVTEMFQSFSKKSILSALKPCNRDYEENEKKYGSEFIYVNWIKCYASNSGILPTEVFDNSRSVSICELPFIHNNYQRSTITNKDCLDFMLNLCRKNGYDIFYKDYSVLGFNTYRVYIPSMSEVDYFSPRDFELHIMKPSLKNTYYNILSSNNLPFFYKSIKDMMNSIRYDSLMYPNKYFHTNNMLNTPYFQMSYFELALITSFLIGDEDATKVLVKKWINENHGLILDRQTRYYLKLVELILQENTSKNITKKEMRENTHEHSDFIKMINAPTCPTCSICIYQKECNKKYQIWLTYQHVLARNYRESIQKKISL